MRHFKKLLSFAASVMLCIAVGIGVAACDDETKESPVKIADGTTIELTVGDSETITVADYITANGNEVTVQSSDTSKATAQLTNGVATVTAVAEGSADISLACGEIQVIFEVIVTAKIEQPQKPQAPVKVKDGIAFELETGGVRTFQVSEYITANGNEVTCSGVIVAGMVEPIADMALTYSFFRDKISVRLRVQRRAWVEDFPRVGLLFPLEKELRNVTWFGRGRGEAYEDRTLACPTGLYKSVVREMYVPYVRPQENGSHCGSRCVALSGGGRTVAFRSETDFSFCASPYTAEDFRPHQFEMRESDDVNLYLDYRMSGLGSHSCGPELDQKYRITEQDIVFSFEISFDKESELG